MQPIVRTAFAAALFAAGGAIAVEPAQVSDPTEAKAAGDRIQKITFMQDDDQKNIVSKIYELKHTKAADLAPFVKSAAIRYVDNSTVSSLEDGERGRQLLIVSTGVDMMPYIDEIVAALDRPGKLNASGSVLAGSGIAYGTYAPQFRAANDMRKIIVGGFVSSGSADSKVRLDRKTNLFYFKDSPARVADIQAKLQQLDRPIPQARIEFTIYEIRDSDLTDVGIDYLAWKNGPGLNLFEAGYEALNMKIAETIFNQLTQTGMDLFGNFTYGFGGMYTAPAFDFSFIRILQQNGRAVINSTASITVSNHRKAEFRVSFSPEYQNIMKDEDHRASVEVGGNASLEAVISNAVITGGKSGVINFNCSLNGANVVERNNLGTEISETTALSTTATLDFTGEKVLAGWKLDTDVEQTIGIPFLCELPILKYIFGTTTSNRETTHYFVTARAVPVEYDENVESGLMTEFKELAKNN